MSWLLAYAVSNTLVALPLAGIAWLVSRYARRPALAHLLWIGVLIKLLTPPLFTAPVQWPVEAIASRGEITSAASRPNEVAALPSAPAVPATLNNAAGPRRPASRAVQATTQKRLIRRATAPPSWRRTVSLPTFGTIAFSLWMAGSLIVALRAIYSMWQFQRVLRYRGRTDIWLNARLASLVKQVGLVRAPAITVVDGTFSPMLWGFGRQARLIFPGELALRLDRQACDALLLHEMAHYWRGDHWVRALELLCRVAFWWNPLVWLARREIEASEELCCDAWVVARQQGSPRSYAEALLATIDFLNEETPSLPPIASSLGEISLLRRRLTRIMLGELAANSSPLMRLAIVASTILIAPLGLAMATGSRADARVLSSRVTASQPKQLTSHKRLSRTQRDLAAAKSPDATVDGASALPQVSAGPQRLRLPADHWATALSPSGKHQFEARGGLRTRLVDVENRSWNVDFSSNRITSISFAPDDRFATGQQGDFQVRMWDATGGFLGKLEGAESDVHSVAFSPNATHVAAGTADGKVLVWDAASRENTAQLSIGHAVSCVRWSPAGDQLAISTSSWNEQLDGARVLIWNPSESGPSAEFALDRPVSAIVWGQDDILAAVAWDGAGLNWNIRTGNVLSQFDIGKDLPSAAAWSPDCPLVRQRVAATLEGELSGS